MAASLIPESSIASHRHAAIGSEDQQEKGSKGGTIFFKKDQLAYPLELIAA
jgi:hypothetical protein